MIFVKVDVYFENGDFYSATAFTYENLTSMKEKNTRTGECLSGKYFWSAGMFFVESLERSVVEEVVYHLLEEGEFKFVFRKIQATKTIWVFNGSGDRAPGGVFEELEDAENWIAKNFLSGMLTEYPVNIGVLDWAIEEYLVNMNTEKLMEKRQDPRFVGSFTTASMNHFHYDDGKRE